MKLSARPSYTGVRKRYHGPRRGYRRITLFRGGGAAHPEHSRRVERGEGRPGLSIRKCSHVSRHPPFFSTGTI